MALRFQTRLALAMSFLVAATIVVMAVLVIWLTASQISRQYHDSRMHITRLTSDNVQYSILTPARVLDRLADQMVVTALAVSELADLAERSEDFAPEDLERRLRRIAQRSKGEDGKPLVDEIWVADETGRIYAGLEDIDFVFGESESGQSAPFLVLLESGSAPVIQDVAPRDKDGEPFKYVGVGGVDEPRIVQVGIGQDAVREIDDAFSVQALIDNFASALDFTQILVVNADGVVEARASDPEHEPSEVRQSRIIEYCRDFLLNTDESMSIAQFDAANGDRYRIGAVTRIYGPAEGEQRALFVEHQHHAVKDFMSQLVKAFAVLSVLMIGAAIVVSIALSRSFSRPIETLAEGAESFGRGELDHRVQLRGGGEFEGLALAFNSMADSVQDSMRELETETKRRERLESELNIAAEMQRSLLPAASPALSNFRITGWSQPAREVGGDFFDYIWLDDHRLGVAIGDASGKGLSAAMLVTECWSALRALAEGQTPAELLYRTNNALCQQVGDSGRFVTLFFMLLDARTGRLTYSSAGHNPPVLCGSDPGRRRELKSRSGFPLGIMRNARFDDVTLQLEAGDTVALYSDGITEARDVNDRLYGEERFYGLVGETCGAPLTELMNRVRRDVLAHMAGRDLSDDMTLVGVRYRPKEEQGEAAEA
jgi:serine phosphatase RsbU (regulator of sigma subunit)